MTETIVAISTPPGRGGIGIVRLSGADAKPIAETVLRLPDPLAHRRASIGRAVDPVREEKLDDAVVTYFAAPHSYTGEDVVEIALHGAPVILEALVRHTLAAGARLAAPGEFTERAFLNGRIDLTQAEAVRDLIEAQTLYQARVAAQQMEGALSRRIQQPKRLLVELIAELEAGIDFAEDDISVLPKEQLLAKLRPFGALLQPVAESFTHGQIVHRGLTLAIAGRTNAGKSSLFNRLVESEQAIVTAAPGTTRDPVMGNLSLGGLPVRLIDTAGLRDIEDEPSDEAEKIGIGKSREALAGADIVLLVLDATRMPRLLDPRDAFDPSAPEKSTDTLELAMLAGLEHRRVIVVVNKIDLLPAPPMLRFAGREVVSVSALSGEGIVELKERMLALVRGGGEMESGMLTNLRQAQAVTDALASLSAAQEAAEQGIPHEMILLDLYAALRHLDSLTGETTPDDILHLIFSSFCIGK